MSEFSKEAIDAITTNLDDIRRRLSLNIEGDSLESIDGEILVPLKELEEIRIAGGTIFFYTAFRVLAKAGRLNMSIAIMIVSWNDWFFIQTIPMPILYGQILPVVDADKQVTYEFTPGPFTTIIRDAYRNPMR
jgi:hypothetical protein